MKKRPSNYCYALMQELPSEFLTHPACPLIFSTQTRPTSNRKSRACEQRRVGISTTDVLTSSTFSVPANDHIHWLKLRPWLHIRDLVYGHKRCVSGVSSQLWRSLHQPQGASFSIDTSTRPSWITHGTLTESKTLSLSEQTRFVPCKLNISTQFTEIF